MLLPKLLLGENAANPSTINASALGGPSDPRRLDVSIIDPRESTLDIDPNTFVTPDAAGIGPSEVADVDLAQPRVKPTPEKIDAKANENAAATGAVAGTAITEAVSIWANVQTLKAEDKIFMDKIQRGYETLEFNQRMIRNASNMAALDASLNAIDSIKRQGGNVSAGGQEQLFLRSPNSGRIV